MKWDLMKQEQYLTTVLFKNIKEYALNYYHNTILNKYEDTDIHLGRCYYEGVIQALNKEGYEVIIKRKE